MMRLVADESCDFAVVSAVRSAGHDVIFNHGADAGCRGRAGHQARRNRASVTAHGRQGFWAAAKDNSGVILIRYPSTARSTLTDEVVNSLPSGRRACTAASWSWNLVESGSHNSSNDVCRRNIRTWKLGRSAGGRPLRTNVRRSARKLAALARQRDIYFLGGNSAPSARAGSQQAMRVARDPRRTNSAEMGTKPSAR